MKVKVDIISGFLGAGKTTLIKKLMSKKLATENVVIIENEFGEVSIDKVFLRETNLEVREINSGCICCTLAGSFEKAVAEVIVDYKPDRVIIEPSGVGKLSDVIKACKSASLKDLLSLRMIIAVVDACNFLIYLSNFGEFYENQIKNAKTIILSRTQKMKESRLVKVIEKIRSLNQSAVIITTPWDELEAEKILEAVLDNSTTSFEVQLRKSVRLPDSFNKHCGTEGGSADEVFTSWSTETIKSFNIENLRAALSQLNYDSMYGVVLRAKGILKSDTGSWFEFNYVPDEISIRETVTDYTGRLCVIGKNLNKQALTDLFEL